MDLNEVDAFGGDLPGEGHDQFIASHGIATDSTGAIYIAQSNYVRSLKVTYDDRSVVHEYGFEPQPAARSD